MPYKLPRIIRARSGDWRVVYEYEIPGRIGKYKKFYVRDEINYIHDLQEKEKATLELKADIELALRRRHNQFAPKVKVESQIFAEETVIRISEEIKEPKAWSMKMAIGNLLQY